jgi:uncharacterized repeat protein (TIGR03843 family)
MPQPVLARFNFQLYVEADPEIHYFTLSEEQKQHLRPTALFDVIINNADRKSGHILIDEDHHLWLIDHGVSFHEEYKLRTVVWDFVGETIPEDLLLPINNLVAELGLGAIRQRSSRILENPSFPPPGPGRPYPWPLV